MRRPGINRSLGYTLLEILLATTVLVIGLAAVLNLTQAGRKKSIAASDLSAVQLTCQSTLNRLLAQQAPIQPFGPIDLMGVSRWKIALQIYPSPKEGLYVLHMVAQKFEADGVYTTGPPFHLLRWVPEHRIKLPQKDDPLELDLFEDPYG